VDYLSQIIGKPVLDEHGETFGTVAELVVTPDGPLPYVSAFQIKTGDGALFMPSGSIAAAADGKGFVLTAPLPSITPYMPQHLDFSLVRDVLDKQIVDVHDYRVVRVNDIRLAKIKRGSRLVLLGVDIGFGGMLRRLGLHHVAAKLAGLLHIKSSLDNFIQWQDVESLPTHNAGEALRLRVSHEKIAKLHPADIGHILNQLDPADRITILEQLDIDIAADALAEAEDEVQVSALRTMDDEIAADILEEMRADEAADVLGDLDNARREELLDCMEAADREDLRELLTYKDESAGGMMTNQFVAIEEGMTASQTIDYLRNIAPDAETIYYIYVVDPEEHLAGVISLRDLIVSAPDAVVATFMIRNAISVPVTASLQDVARQFERYKLLAIPVIDDERKLVGIITVDDTLEQLLPDDWRKRPIRHRAHDDSG
jgi:CBS domain-containing protein